MKKIFSSTWPTIVVLCVGVLIFIIGNSFDDSISEEWFKPMAFGVLMSMCVAVLLGIGVVVMEKTDRIKVTFNIIALLILGIYALNFGAEWIISVFSETRFLMCMQEIVIIFNRAMEIGAILLAVWVLILDVKNHNEDQLLYDIVGVMLLAGLLVLVYVPQFTHVEIFFPSVFKLLYWIGLYIVVLLFLKR